MPWDLEIEADNWLKLLGEVVAFTAQNLRWRGTIISLQEGREDCQGLTEGKPKQGKKRGIKARACTEVRARDNNKRGSESRGSDTARGREEAEEARGKE